MPTSKLSRRDALKILMAATGAAGLSNLPATWSRPELQVGVLPAHAQTSTFHILSAPSTPEEVDPSRSYCWDGILVRFTASLTPPTPGIPLQYALTYTVTGAPGSITSPSPTTNVITTNGSGQASVDVVVQPDSPFFGTTGTLTVVWSFTNPADGANTISQSYDIDISC